MTKIKFATILLAIVIPIICIAGTIYEDARNYAITLYNKGQYREAVSQFIAAQDIAPVNNDITLWLSKCNRNIALQNNKKRVSQKQSTPYKKNNNGTPIKQAVPADNFVVYDSIGRYNDDGIALAMLNGKFGYINKNKDVIVPVIYDNVDIFGKPSKISVGDFYRSVLSYKGDWSGIAMSVQRDGKWGFADKNGIEIVACKYDIVENHISRRDSLIPVAIEDKYGYIDTKGNVAIPLEYEFAGTFSSDGIAPVVKNSKLGFINHKGETIIDFEYDPKYEISAGKAKIKDSFWLNDIIAISKGGKWGLIDKTGKEVYPFEFDDFVTWKLEGTSYKSMHIFTFTKDNKDCYFFNGKIYNNEEQLKEAKLIYKAKFNDANYIFDLAAYYWDKGEYNPSSVWAEKGDKLDHAGCSRLVGAYWLFYTDTPSMASYYLNKAAEKEDAIAQYLLGLMYEEDLILGNGKKKDKNRNIFNHSEAIDWYKKSAKNGNQQAIERLKSLGVNYNERTN